MKGGRLPIIEKNLPVLNHPEIRGCDNYNKINLRITGSQRHHPVTHVFFLRIFEIPMDQVPETNVEPIIPKYNLNPEQEKKEIIRHYRALLRSLRPKLKKGDKELVRTAFEMAAEAHKTMRRKVASLISCIPLP